MTSQYIIYKTFIELAKLQNKVEKSSSKRYYIFLAIKLLCARCKGESRSSMCFSACASIVGVLPTHFAMFFPWTLPCGSLAVNGWATSWPSNAVKMSDHLPILHYVNLLDSCNGLAVLLNQSQGIAAKQSKLLALHVCCFMQQHLLGFECRAVAEGGPCCPLQHFLDGLCL